MRKRGADRLARQPAWMPETQSAALLVVEFLGQRTEYLERVLDTGVSLEAGKRVDNGAQWVYEHLLKLPGAAKQRRFSKRVTQH